MVSETKTYPFVASQMAQIPKKEFNMEKGGLHIDYKLTGYVPTPEGGKTFLMENKFTNWNDTYYINNFNILVLRSGKDGNFQWAANVYKKQYQILPRTMGFYYYLWKTNPSFNMYQEQVISYSSLFKGDNVYLLYVDNAKNLSNSEKELKDTNPFSTDENACFVAKVNKVGTVEKSILLNLKAEIYRPAFSGSVSKGSELMVTSYDNDSKVPAFKLGLFQVR